MVCIIDLDEETIKKNYAEKLIPQFEAAAAYEFAVENVHSDPPEISYSDGEIHIRFNQDDTEQNQMLYRNIMKRLQIKGGG